MKIITKWAWALASAQLLAAAPGNGPDPLKWDAIVKKFVNASARVDYAGLRRHGLAELDAYLNELAAPWPDRFEGNARKSTLINAYNALTIRWIVANYPVESIHKTSNPFKEERHTVNGLKVSLDQVEGELRELKDPRVHSVLVCAARSCPPLRREAYVAGRLDAQLDDNTRAWLGNSQLNEFLPDQGMAAVSPIFKWYAEDFAATEGLRSFLFRHVPRERGSFLLGPRAKIQFKDYDWGLNDDSAHGADYSHWNLYLDVAIHNPIVRWPAVGALGVLAGGAFEVFRRRRKKLAK